MEAALEGNATHLDDPHTPTLCAVVDRQLLQQYDAVGDGMELKIVVVRGEVVQQDHGGPAAGEEVFERKDLPPVA